MQPIVNSIRRASARAAGLVAHLATLAVLAAASAAPADAQTSCTAGTVASYATAGHSCRLGDWLFHNFVLDVDIDAQDGAEALVVDPLAATMSPFVGTDAAGRVTFGFDFTDFMTAAGSHGTQSGFEFADAFTGLYFDVTALSPTSLLAGSRIGGVFDGFNQTPYELQVMSYFGASIQSRSGQGECLVDAVQDAVASPTAVALGRDCDAPLPGAVTAILYQGSDVSRQLFGTRPVDGFSGISLTRFELTQAAPTVTPEPGTIVLVAGGLFALAGVGRVRARSRGARGG